MSIRTSKNAITSGRALVLGGFDEVTPERASSVTTGELGASLKREQADRQAVERGENEGMVVHPDQRTFLPRPLESDCVLSARPDRYEPRDINVDLSILNSAHNRGGHPDAIAER